MTNNAQLPLAGGTMSGDVDFGDNDITNIDSLDADKLSIAGGTEMTGFIDSDTMSGTSATIISSSESIKAYVDSHMKYSESTYFYFAEESANRTYFRDADDPNDIMSWDGFDTEDSTSVDDTATIVTVNAVSGVVVPYACTYVGAYFLGYQSSATAGEGIFQTWTGVPGDGTGSASTTVTLRTTNTISANRSSESIATSDISISLAAGSMIYPAFQYVSGTNPVWYGNIALKFENITV